MEPRVVKYSKNLKRISLQRYLVSKFCYEGNKLRERDLLCIYDNQLWLERKSETDFDFKKKFGNSLEELSEILKEANFSQGLSRKALKRLSQKFGEKLSGFVVPNRNYLSFRTRFDGSYHLLTLTSSETKNIPPKRFIGIGYRDKGNARDLALDGSPSWQEIASSGGQTAMWKENLRNAKTFKDIERVFKQEFGVVPDGKGDYTTLVDAPKEAKG